MARVPTQSREKGMKEAASKTADDVLTEADKVRRRSDVGERGRRTLDQIQEDARNLGEYARGKMEHMNDVMRDAAASARDSTGLPRSAPVSTDSMSDTVMESLKSASEKLSDEISELGERVDSIKARVAQSMQAAGGKAKETWIQSSEAAKNVGEREYCLPLPTDRICARHVAVVGLPLLALFLLVLMRRRYPKKWKASVDKMKQPRASLAREVPSSDKLKAKLEGAVDSLEEKLDYGKQRATTAVDEAQSKYGQLKKKEQ
ncbi:hypothetical protein PsorP6_013152 [Peronosclerospora sorghi]|uniref:Uncharacterized protein n=1 Tax=Peronosclerospora sorghi TaxID=230839 RepID=A0ACC0WJI9_9STRA|nr:hypothetical protein PsorP6_013152 [Peronosclerospora sorghi]